MIDNKEYEAKAQAVISEIFKRTSIKMDSSDPFVVLFVTMQDFYYEGLNSALNIQKEDWEKSHENFFNQFDARTTQLNEAVQKLDKQKEAIVAELVTQNKAIVQNLFFDRLEKYQKKQNLILIGIISLLLIVGVML